MWQRNMRGGITLAVYALQEAPMSVTAAAETIIMTIVPHFPSAAEATIQAALPSIATIDGDAGRLRIGVSLAWCRV
jgi:hypothetical protein